MNKLMIALMVAGAFVVGCGGEKSGASGSASGSGAAAAGGDKIGIQACDDYIAKMEACFGKDPATKAAMEPGMKATRDGWKASAAASKEATETSCKAALANVPANCK